MKEITIKNKKAYFEYFLLETFEAGIVLTGSEVKSIRAGGGELVNSYITIGKDLEVFTNGLKIRRPRTGKDESFNPEREKKLLLHKKQIKKLAEGLKGKGITIIPTRLYFNKRGLAKLEIAIARGKADFDKRKTIKERDIKRQEQKIGIF